MTDKKLYGEISLDDLEEVSGGRIKLTGYGLLKAYMLQMKQLGKDKDEAVRKFINSWETDAPFKTKFTDGTDADLQQALDFIDTYWK